MSLLSSLAALDDPCPTSELPALPESNFESDSQEELNSDDEGAQDTSHRRHRHEHYVDVAPSALRKKTLDETSTLQGRRYAGETVSASKLLGGETEEEDDSEDEEEDSEQELDNDSEENNVSSQLLQRHRATSPATRVSKSLRFASEEPISSTEAEVGVEDDGTLASAAASDAALLASLRAKAQDDGVRGRAVREIQSAWESAVGVRIRAQAFVRGAGRVEPSKVLEEASSSSDVATSRSAILAQLDTLSLNLFTLRSSLVSETEDPSVSSVIRSSLDTLKRKRSTLQDDDEEGSHRISVRTYLEVHQATQQRALGVLDAWSIGAQSSSSGSKAASSLKAVNRGAGEQVRAALRGEGLERLVKRSQVWRGDARIGEEEDTAEKATSPSTFDDSDFYATLLRELIDAKSGAVDAGDLTAGAASGGKVKIPKRAVDTRASKGRRIRYEVHEKAANFMPPVPRETWSEEQRKRLFSQLAGSTKSLLLGATETPADAEEQTQEVELDGLRMFG